MPTRDDRTIELLAPKTAKAADRAALRPREFEDAEFETVIPCDGYGAPEGLFIPSVTPETRRPIFACAETPEFTAERQRLDLFSRRGAPAPEGTPTSRNMAGPVMLCGVVALALVGFSMTVGERIASRHAAPDPVITSSVPQNPGLAAPEPGAPYGSERAADAALPPMPTQGAEIVADEASSARGPAKLTIQEAPRPARIERAGSILMIRSGG
jgi:hypothetical protein